MAENIPGAEGDARSFTAVELQQQYYEIVGDADWELYEKNERKYLLQKIAIAMLGPPTEEGNLEEEQDVNELKLQGYGLRETETVMKVFHKICEQAKFSHNGDNILISILRVICIIPRKEVPFFVPTPRDYWLDLHNKKGFDVNHLIFHVFSLRKCITMKPNSKGCKIYIDHDSRVYQTWEDYLTENKLPQSVMVVPMDGAYKGTIKEMNTIPVVKLTVVPSPALGVTARVLSAADTASTVANIGGLVAIVGGLAIPAVAPVALGTAVGIAAVTGTYGIVRSSLNLADRKKHEEDIGLLDSDARASWINIVISTAGLSLGAATKLLSWAASSGTNVQIFMRAVTFLQYTNFGTSAVGVINSLGEIIYKFNKYKESPSGVEIFQFTTSVLFLGIGVMSNQTAQDIVHDAQANTINEIRDSLSSNTKRKMFDKVTAETRRLEGTIKGNSDVIKALKNIDNKDDFFAKLVRINKDANKNKIRISLSSDGSTVINNQHKVNLAEFYNLGRKGRNQMFAEYGPAQVNSRNAPTRIYPSNASANSTNSREEKSENGLRVGAIITISKFLIQLSQRDQEFVAELISDISADVHDEFFILCAEIVASLLPDEIAILSCNMSPHNFKMQVVIFVFRYLKSLVNECDYENDGTITIILKEFVKNGRVSKKTILMLKKLLFENDENNENSDVRAFDDIHKYRKAYRKTFVNLRAGETITVERHKIVVKPGTIEKLEEGLANFSQTKCDQFMKISFKIISLLSTSDIEFLNLFNPDEDVITIVTHYLFTETPVTYLLEEFCETDDIQEIAADMQCGLLQWRRKQKVRRHIICSSCKGLCFYR